MSQANITINNGLATPAPVTFIASRFNGDTVEYLAPSSGANYGAMHKLVITRRAASASVKGTKVTLKILRPEQVLVNGLPSSTWVNWSEHTFYVDKNSSQAARDDLFAYAKNLLGVSNIEAVVADYAGLA